MTTENNKLDIDDGSVIDTGVNDTPFAFSSVTEPKETRQYTLFQKQNLRRITILGIVVNEREFIKIMAVILLCVTLIVLFHYINLKHSSQRTPAQQRIQRRNGFVIAGSLMIVIVTSYIVSIQKYFYLGSSLIMLGLLISVLLFSLEISGYYKKLFKVSLIM